MSMFTYAIIMRDTTGITIKRTIQSENHVRIGVFDIVLWVDGVRRNVRKIGKPHNEFTINECSDLLEELDRLERGV
jgi:hypothetical protein